MSNVYSHQLQANRGMDSQILVMKDIMSASKMISQSKKHEHDISQLRCTLRKLQMRTFPSFPSSDER